MKVEGLSRIITIPAIFYNEFLTIRFSDKLIVLNNREKKELKRVYLKHKNKEIYTIPLFFEDRYNNEIEKNEKKYEYLFIGSGFFANIYGVSWFIDNVLSQIKGKLLVIGFGMEKLKEKYGNNEKLEIIGGVENIDKYYYENNIIISPIFHGSGMKTKTIEAMMFNKLIVGTNEAFVGIKEEDINKSGFCCNNENEFIEILKKLENKKIETKSREVYLENFSKEKIKKEFLKIFDVKESEIK